MSFGRDKPFSLLKYTAPFVVARGQVSIVYLDLSKAFDKGTQKLLLYKLSLYSASPLPLLWCISYLNNRQGNVRVSNSLTDAFVPTSDEPQGTNLEPFLFLLFISDIEYCVRNRQLLLFSKKYKPLFRNSVDE